jgi:hypothetical protein
MLESAREALQCVDVAEADRLIAEVLANGEFRGE